jgi:hypothetical protein
MKKAADDQGKQGNAREELPARACADLLKQALGKCDLADVRFHIIGAWVASGHRAFLGARSPVFARMFQNNTEEKNTGIVKLDDVTMEGFVAFLELLYLGADVNSILLC